MNPTPAAAGHDLSPLALFLQADLVVKGVMLLLVLASVACWGIIIEKMAATRRLRAEARRLAAAAAGGPAPESGPAALAFQAGAREWQEGRDPAESRGEYRHRIEQAMRAPLTAAFRAAEPGLPLLATIGAVSPFVGLFGTVWGIMNAFSGIAASGDTSLAVVAPGIAEALFATAIGLAAAIPAVVAYNRFVVAIARIRQGTSASVATLAGTLARRVPATPVPDAQPRADAVLQASPDGTAPPEAAPRSITPNPVTPNPVTPGPNAGVPLQAAPAHPVAAHMAQAAE